MTREQPGQSERGGTTLEQELRRPAKDVAALQRLGIDVWVRRRPPRHGYRKAPMPPQAAPAVPHRRPAPVPSVPQRVPARTRAPVPKPVQVAAPEAEPATEPFRIHCFHFGNVFAAVAAQALPQRRLLQDVALAMNGFDAAERRDIVFDWPLPGASPDGAERAFRAFFGHQTRNAPRTLVAGDRVAQLLGCAPPAACAIVDGRLYIPPGPLETAAKKALWRLISELGP